MTTAVSVVMSTFNEADRLEQSIDSVLDQDAANFELVIVNDGSPDGRTATILDAKAAGDSRMRVLHKENAGLTRALIDGCDAAKGDYVARLDAGDRYLPGRIEKQRRFLDDHPDIAVCCCGTRFVDDDGETVLERSRSDSPDTARHGLRADKVRDLKGVTHHGAVMFRREVYESVGGYRSEFYFAQDVDLWSRMTDRHGIGCLPEVLYAAHFTASGISSCYNREQVRLGRLIIEMRRRRDAGLAEDALLAAAARIRPDRPTEAARRVNRARGEYFAGCLMTARTPDKAAVHFRRAVAANPLHVKALIKLIQVSLLRNRAVKI